ncbi:MAG: phospholipid carrier-dependent glycosyltransferase [Cyanobacteria bacterium J06623_5]
MRRFGKLAVGFGLVAVVGLGFGLRFWQIGRFNSLVFDEVYYAQFAQAYLEGYPVFDAHPPLGKYLIAAGIWLHAHGSIDYTAQLSAGDVTADIELLPLSYRWMNAFVGACIPILVVAIARTLTSGRSPIQSWIFSLLAGTFVAIDGLFVTESRYALLNVYGVFFGLLGHWLWLSAQVAPRPTRTRLRVLAGVALGAAIGVKWNGLGYVLSLLLWDSCCDGKSRGMRWGKTVAFLRAAYMGVVPFVVYWLIWWPHLQLTGETFVSIHWRLFSFHQQLNAIQTACSRWYTWPLLIKPIAYWYEDFGETVYTVNNIGNPALWWLSAAAVLILCLSGLWQIQRWGWVLANRNNSGHGDIKGHRDISSYLLIGYLSNWVPWVLVHRCTYLYLHMPAAVFGFMALAWLMSGWFGPGMTVATRVLAGILLGAIALAFFFWLPLSLGSPLTPDQLQLRWWLPSWI